MVPHISRHHSEFHACLLFPFPHFLLLHSLWDFLLFLHSVETLVGSLWNIELVALLSVEIQQSDFLLHPTDSTACFQTVDTDVLQNVVRSSCRGQELFNAAVVAMVTRAATVP